jgi:hypothetical protein
MVRKTLLLAIPVAALIFAATAAPSNAFVGLFIMADKWFKDEAKKAAQTPGHAEWCASFRPGYRPQWNNWRLPNGRVTYCASPFYTPPWQFKTQ